MLKLRVPTLLAPLTLALLACGGSNPPAADPTLTPSQANPASPTTNGDATLHSNGSAGSKKAERRTNPLWATCHASFQPTLNVDEVTLAHQMAQGCAEISHMHMLDSFKGKQSATDSPQVFHFKALEHHCYRAYAVSARDVQDLDIVMKDSTGAIAGEDSTDDPTPVILEDGAVCFNDNDQATIVASVGAGNGAYAVEVWSD